MADSARFKGERELYKFLSEFAQKPETVNAVRGALRAGMNVVKPVAQSNVHSVSGELAQGLTVDTRTRGTVVTASLKATGRHRSIAALVEFGTAAHNIAAKIGGSLSFLNVFRKTVRHPGARAKPFMRPALDVQAGAAVAASADYLNSRLATKSSLGTASGVIRSDE